MVNRMPAHEGRAGGVRDQRTVREVYVVEHLAVDLRRGDDLVAEDVAPAGPRLEVTMVAVRWWRATTSS